MFFIDLRVVKVGDFLGSIMESFTLFCRLVLDLLFFLNKLFIYGISMGSKLTLGFFNLLDGKIDLL